MRKTVLITGGAKGLGKEVAKKFAKGGYDVIFTYLSSEEEAIRLKAEIEQDYGVNVTVFKLDLTNEEEVKKLFASIQSLDVLVNNAAYNNDKAIFDKSTSDFMSTLQTNLIGPFLMCKYARDLLIASKGNVINISSTNGIDTMYEESADYDASKAGLINLTMNLASAFAPNVRVNTVAPGWIETHKTLDMNPSFKSSEESKILLGRFAKAEEVAEVVYFVASEEASYVNASVIRVDGGVRYGN